jgi:hypothetical protein
MSAIPAAQVLPRFSYTACPVVLQTQLPGATSGRIRYYFPQGLSCWFQLRV